jgi:hypothetical protein
MYVQLLVSSRTSCCCEEGTHLAVLGTRDGVCWLAGRWQAGRCCRVETIGRQRAREICGRSLNDRERRRGGWGLKAGAAVRPGKAAPQVVLEGGRGGRSCAAGKGDTAQVGLEGGRGGPERIAAVLLLAQRGSMQGGDDDVSTAIVSSFGLALGGLVVGGFTSKWSGDLTLQPKFVAATAILQSLVWWYWILMALLPRRHLWQRLVVAAVAFAPMVACIVVIATTFPAADSFAIIERNEVPGMLTAGSGHVPAAVFLLVMAYGSIPSVLLFFVFTCVAAALQGLASAGMLLRQAFESPRMPESQTKAGSWRSYDDTDVSPGRWTLTRSDHHTSTHEVASSAV